MWLVVERLDDGQPVLPHRPVDFGRRAPGLRRELEDEGLIALAVRGVDEFPPVDRVLALDVAVERGFLRLRDEDVRCG